jgi:hypothetical protein
MPEGIALSDFYYILPEMVLTVGALVVLIVDVLLPTARRGAAAEPGTATGTSPLDVARGDRELVERSKGHVRISSSACLIASTAS